MALVSKSEAARILGVSRQAVSKWEGKPFIVGEGRAARIDTDHPEWKRLVSSPKERSAREGKQAKQGGVGRKARDELKSLMHPSEHHIIDELAKKIPGIEKGLLAAAKKIKGEQDADNDQPLPTVPDSEYEGLAQQALIAEWQEKIHNSKIKQEKAIQEEIKTAQLKKDLAPMYLVKHFFTFGETMIHRGFRRYHEIIPELKALFLAGKDQEAELLLTREQEVIVKDSQRDLIKAIEEEGYSVDM